MYYQPESAITNLPGPSESHVCDPNKDGRRKYNLFKFKRDKPKYLFAPPTNMLQWMNSSATIRNTDLSKVTS